jgi:ABC-type antimicrobial peptide transport system permease subunit
MALLFRTHFKLAHQNVRANRTRSFLTCLGVAIGTASIVLILSISGSVNSFLSNQINENDDILVVSSASSSPDTPLDAIFSSELPIKIPFSTTELSEIRQLAGISAIAPLSISAAPLYGDHSISASVIATSPDLADILSLSASSGDFLRDQMPETSVVLGASLADALFKNENVIGKTIQTGTSRLIVAGVLSKQSSPSPLSKINIDNSLFINLSSTTLPSAEIFDIIIKANFPSDIPALSSEISSLLTVSRNSENTVNITSGDSSSTPNPTLSLVSNMLALTAGISLVVGGIGIMNILLVSVAERSREIGIRKAVGATNRQILLQFLSESFILSFLGTLFGFTLAYLASGIIFLFTSLPLFISPEIIAISFAIALGTGLLFGLYPALKASRKNPITSLKHYR